MHEKVECHVFVLLTFHFIGKLVSQPKTVFEDLYCLGGATVQGKRRSKKQQIYELVHHHSNSQLKV